MAAASKTVSAEYSLPYLAHAPMEPMNCTAEVTADGVDVWTPNQFQSLALKAAADAAGVSSSKVRIHTTYLGGAFGRRNEIDQVQQAVTLAKAMGKPVQVIWSREEDIQHDFYRPAVIGRLSAGLDAQGMPVAWSHRMAAQSFFARIFPAILWVGSDPGIVEGATEIGYRMPNHSVEYAAVDTPIPIGPWRSVGHSHNAFLKECFMDEVAEAGGLDPIELRRRLLADEPRLRAVLDLAAAKGDWGKPMAPGEGRGIALHASFGSIVVQVAEVAVGGDGTLKVKRVVAAVDCGTIVNPDIVKAQVESAIVYGLTAALYGKITLDKGRVVQSNFPDYEMVRLAQMPRIEVHLVDSEANPGGIGEPGTPPIAPAVVNAIFAATGKRVRALPLMDAGFKV
jgi:isoquinoline 1-oxidoreductase beta subunit